MKQFLYLLICLILCLNLSACKDTTPRIFLSTKPITRETFIPMDKFKVNDTINFVLISPKGFKSDTIRLQLLKKSNLSAIYGYTLALGKDYNIIHDNYLIGSYTVYSAGRYELMFFEPEDKQKKTIFTHKTYYPGPRPLAYVEFGVYN